MFAKVLAISAIVAYAQAGVIGLAQQSLASSYSSVNQNNLAPIAALQAGPLAYARAPVVQTGVIGLAQKSLASSYSSVSNHNVAPIARLAPIAQYGAPIAQLSLATPLVKAVQQEVYAHPQYSFKYGVQDAHTGDAKNQQESRDGDVVKGEYSLVQPDGVTRTVQYSVDDHNGFVAQVSYSGQAVQKAVVAKTVLAAPVLRQAPILSNYIH